MPAPRLLGASGDGGDPVRVPTRYPPSVSLQEVDEESVVLRVSAAPLCPDDGLQLAEQVLAALKPAQARSG